MALPLIILPPVSAQNPSHSIMGTTGNPEETPTDMALRSFVLGAAYEFQEDYAQALSAYEEALRIDDDAIVHLAIARVSHELLDEVTAAHHLVHALETRPDDAVVLRQLGEIYSGRQLADSAMIVLEELRRVEGDSENLLQALGSLYAQQRFFDRAASIYDTLRMRFPENAMYALMHAEMELNSGDWAAASDILLPLSDDPSVGHEDRIRIGKLYFQKALQEPADIERAIEVFDNLKRAFPDDWRPLWFRGAVLFQAGSVAEAIRDFEQVMKLSPGNTEAGMILARAYVTRSRPADALKILQQIIDRGSATTDTWTLFGYAWSMLGRDDRAAEALEQARRADPANLEILATLAITYTGLKQYDSADAVSETVIRRYSETGRLKDDQYYLLLNNYAFTLAERGVNLEHALTLSSEAVEHAPGNSAYCDTRGWIHFRLEQYDEAVDWLRKALQLREAADDPSATLHEHIGEAYFALGRRAEARAHWEESLRQQPDNPPLQEKLRNLLSSDQ
ncbi:MAG: tetratricopeptide repeat protein [Bacteroidota bacterium]